MGQGARDRRIVEEMSGLQKEATVSAAPVAFSLLGGWIAEKRTDPTAQGGHGIVELRAGGRTQLERENTPHLTLCLLRFHTRHRIGGSVRAGRAARLHQVGHHASPFMAAFDRGLCRDNCVACSSRYRWRQA